MNPDEWIDNAGPHPWAKFFKKAFLLDLVALVVIFIILVATFSGIFALSVGVIFFFFNYDEINKRKNASSC